MSRYARCPDCGLQMPWGDYDRHMDAEHRPNGGLGPVTPIPLEPERYLSEAVHELATAAGNMAAVAAGLKARVQILEAENARLREDYRKRLLGPYADEA